MKRQVIMLNFKDEAMRTESSEFNMLVDKDANMYKRERLVHAAMGMQTETAEFTDALKKSLFYGKTLDVTNLKEELGDLLWYVAIAMDELDTDFETEMERVINKLKVRYPEKFTRDAAEDRDLDAEREVLEDGK